MPLQMARLDHLVCGLLWKQGREKAKKVGARESKRENRIQEKQGKGSAATKTKQGRKMKKSKVEGAP